MASSDQAIIFSIETDSFLSSPLVEEGLDKKWLDLAEVLLGENRNNRQQKLSDFKTVLYADPKLSKFMTPTLLQSNTYLNIYLRAGAWDVTAALAVLNNFYSLGLNYKPYVEMSFPSKYCLKLLFLLLFCIISDLAMSGVSSSTLCVRKETSLAEEFC